MPDVDTRRVVGLRRGASGFELELDDGDNLAAGRVIIATGPGGHSRRPPEFDHLAAPLACHSGEVQDPGAFRDRSTLVVGSGQSAIELAALLHEAGADVEVIARAGAIRWLRRSGWLHARMGCCASCSTRRPTSARWVSASSSRGRTRSAGCP